MSTPARPLCVFVITEPPLGTRPAAFKRELENHRVVVEDLLEYWKLDHGKPLRYQADRFEAAFESRWDAVVVVPDSGGRVWTDSTWIYDAYFFASQVQERTGRPRLFLSLVDGTNLTHPYSRGMPTLLPEEPQEAVPLLITAMKAASGTDSQPT